MLFQRFDRLLFLAKGKFYLQVYSSGYYLTDLLRRWPHYLLCELIQILAHKMKCSLMTLTIGWSRWRLSYPDGVLWKQWRIQNSRRRQSGRMVVGGESPTSPCLLDEPQRSFVLQVIGAAPGSSSTIDWHQTWLNSPERAGVKAELAEMESNGVSRTPAKVIEKVDKAAYREFAAPFSEQFVEVTKRVFQQYWRTPSYLYSKIVLSTASVRLLYLCLWEFRLMILVCRVSSSASVSWMRKTRNKVYKINYLVSLCSVRTFP